MKKLLTGALVAGTMAIGSMMQAAPAEALDLTSGGSGTTNGGLANFVTLPNGGPPAGTGVIDSFLRIQESPVEEGFNTGYRSGGQAPLDALSDPNFTRNLLLSEVPIVNGARRFFLDLNEPNGGKQPLIDLLELQVFLSPTASLSTLAGLTPIFDLDQVVNLKDINSGSGKYDLYVDIADSLFTGSGPYLYLYSKFGDPSGTPNTDGDSEGGFEEWFVGEAQAQPVPTPALLPGLIGMGVAALRKKKREDEEMVTQEAEA